MLIGNGVRFGGQPMRTLFGANVGNAERARWTQRGAVLNFYAGEATGAPAHRSAIPNGHLAPSAWQLPIKPGGLSSYVGFQAEIGLSATLAAGYAIDAQVDGVVSFDLTLQLQALLTGLIAAEALFSADVVGSAPVSCTVSAVSDWTGDLIALANLTGQLDCDVTFSGDLVSVASVTGLVAVASDWSGDLVPLAILTGAIAVQSDWSANLDSGYGIAGLIAVQSDWSGIASAIAYASGTIAAEALFSMNSAAIAYVEGEISSDVELSPDSLAAAVWAYINRTLTGSGGLSVEQDTRLLELYQRFGLDINEPLTVTSTGISVGDVELVISGNGRTLSTVTRQP